MPKLTKKMLLLEAVVAIGAGNPGAIKAANAIYQESNKDRAKKLPPDMHMLYRADALGLNGVFLHCYYANLCKSDPALAIAVLLGVDLGVIKKRELLEAVKDCSQGKTPGMNVDSVRKSVNMKLMYLSRAITGKA